VLKADFTPCTRIPPHCVQQDTPQQGAWEKVQFCHIEGDRTAFWRFSRCAVSAGQIIKKVAIFAAQERGTSNSRAGRRAGRPVELGDHRVSDTVPRISQIFITFIVTPRLTRREQVRLEVRPRHVEKRTNHFVPPGINAGETGEASSANQFQQHGFSLIILRMAHGDAVGSQFSRDTPEKHVPHASRGIFEGQAVRSREITGVDTIRLNRQRDPCGKVAAERFVCVGRGPQQVIEVCDPGDRKPAMLRKFQKQTRQRDRI
jgi:hypothetical protein